MHALDESPMVISGMYRSGTSILWRVLSADPSFRFRFYEPLHNLLPERLETNDAMQDLRKIPNLLKDWTECFNKHKIKLCREEEYIELYQFLQKIVIRRSITKFTRMTLRLSWLVRKFPHVRVINLVRDPRAVCYSYLSRGGLLSFLEQDNSISGKWRILRYLLQNDARFKPVKPLWNIHELMHESASNHLNEEQNSLVPDRVSPCKTIYCHQEYLQMLQNDPIWSDVARFAQIQPPEIKVLLLWGVNVLQSLNDLQRTSHSKHITIRFEDFIAHTDETLAKIYKKVSDSDVPHQVKNAARRNSRNLERIDNHQYHEKVSQDKIYKWKNIDDEIWLKAIDIAKIGDIMRKLGYLK